ncbi:MAG: hypothetical protein GX767_06810 [Firmicutes bacterium]|nr:hypothetical protein [Bacillota bacterium]
MSTFLKNLRERREDLLNQLVIASEEEKPFILDEIMEVEDQIAYEEKAEKRALKLS